MNRALLQQALDSLIYHRDQTRPIFKCDKTIYALQAELAKPESQPRRLNPDEVTLCHSKAVLAQKHDGTDQSFTTLLAKEIMDSMISANPSQPEPSLTDEITRLLSILADCCDAPPIPPHGDVNELAWIDAMSNPEKIPAYIKLAFQALQATLAEREKAPAWRDAPTVPGLWASYPLTGKVTELDLLYWQNERGIRWCGPLPEDKP